jgi:hypothetical protein
MKKNTKDILQRKRKQRWIELGIAAIGYMIGIGLGIWSIVQMFLFSISK